MERVKYNLLTKRDMKSTTQCIVKTFLCDEPMTKNLGISKKEFEYFAKIICEKMVKEKLSYVCKNLSNRIIGFCLNEDLITKPLKGIEMVTQKMEPIFKVLGGLDKLYLKDKTRKRNYFFHMFMVGVLGEYRSKGLAQKLISNSIELANLRGFSKILTEATNISSQNLFIQKFGFNELYDVNYKKFEHNGLKVFQNIGEKYCKLLELKI